MESRAAESAEDPRYFVARRLDSPGWVDVAVDAAWVVVFLCAVWLVFQAWRSGEFEQPLGDEGGGAFVLLWRLCLAGLAAFLVFFAASALWSGGNILDGGGNLFVAAGLFLKACLIGLAVLWMPFLLVGLATSAVGLTAIFVAVFTLVIAVPATATFLAANFLFPEAVSFPTWTNLLWLVVPASFASVILFDFLLEEVMPRSLRGRIQSEPLLKLAEAVARGFFVALMLVAASRFVPDAAGVSFGAALAAGMVAAFVRFYLGMYLDDSGDAGLLIKEFGEEFD